MDHRLDVAAGNRLAGLLYGRQPRGLNTARHIFLEEARRGLYAGWETCTLDVVGRLRLAAGKYPDDPRPASLIGELAAARGAGSREFGPHVAGRCRWLDPSVRARMGSGELGARTGHARTPVAQRHLWDFTGSLINSQSLTMNYTHPLYTVAAMV